MILLFFLFTPFVLGKTVGDLKREVKELEEKYNQNKKEVTLTEEEMQKTKEEIVITKESITKSNEEIQMLIEEIKKLEKDIEVKNKEMKSIVHFTLATGLYGVDYKSYEAYTFNPRKVLSFPSTGGSFVGR